MLAAAAASSPALASAPQKAAGHAHPVIHPAPVRAVRAAAGGQAGFGPNVYVFTPAMPQSQIQATVDAIAAQQVPNQFGTQRYALLFEPGTYGSTANPLGFQVGYYTEVAGLGQSPGDVVDQRLGRRLQPVLRRRTTASRWITSGARCRT